MRSIFNNIIRIIKENILLIFILVVVLLVSAYAEGNDLDFTIDNQTGNNKSYSGSFWCGHSFCTMTINQN